MVLTRHKNDPHSKSIVCYSLYGIIKMFFFLVQFVFLVMLTFKVLMIIIMNI